MQAQPMAANAIFRAVSVKRTLEQSFRTASAPTSQPGVSAALDALKSHELVPAGRPV